MHICRVYYAVKNINLRCCHQLRQAEGLKRQRKASQAAWAGGFVEAKRGILQQLMEQLTHHQHL